MVLVALLIGIVFAQSGCNAIRENSRQMVDVFKPSDYADSTDDVSDPWIQQAGVEARGNRPREPIEEPSWYHNLWTTPKTRDIERNMGLDVQ
jgi:hypothetical protein